jgi:hypothetical protein
MRGAELSCRNDESALLFGRTAPETTLTVNRRSNLMRQCRGQIFGGDGRRSIKRNRWCARNTLLGRVNLADSSTDMPGSLLVFEIAALSTSTSRRPNSLRMRFAAAAIKA